MYLKVSRLSAMTKSRTLAIVSWFMAVVDLPGQGSSWMLSLPLLKSADHFLAMV